MLFALRFGSGKHLHFGSRQSVPPILEDLIGPLTSAGTKNANDTYTLKQAKYIFLSRAPEARLRFVKWQGIWSEVAVVSTNQLILVGPESGWFHSPASFMNW